MLYHQTMNKPTTTARDIAARLADTIAKATGATLDPIMACPNVEADGALAFCTEPADGLLIVAALAQVHGVEGVTATIDDSDPADVYAVVRIPMAALERRLAQLVARA